MPKLTLISLSDEEEAVITAIEQAKDDCKSFEEVDKLDDALDILKAQYAEKKRKRVAQK